MKTPRHAGRGKNRKAIDNAILFLSLPQRQPLAIACRDLAQRIACARRNYRDTVTPEISDALDTAADALSRAVDAAEECRHE